VTLKLDFINFLLKCPAPMSQFLELFGQLIHRKMAPTDVRQILRLKCTKFDFHWGSAPDPAGGVHSAPPKPISWLSGVLLLREKRKGEGREDRERGKGERGKRGKKGKEGKGQGKGRKRKRRKKAEKEKGKGKRRKRNKKRIGLWPRKGLIRLCMRRAKNEATALDRSGR